MTNEEIIIMNKPNEDQRRMIESIYKTLLEALRHREQEILRYIAILAPALGGFIWLIRDFRNGGQIFIFVIGSIGVLLLLLLGAVYSLALGYNFRQITLQLAKLESEPCLNISQYMLKGWPRRPEKFIKRYGLYCMPPEIIKVFWLAFIVVMLVVMVSIFFLLSNENVDVSISKIRCVLLFCGAIFLIIAVLMPIYYGYKIRGHAEGELCKWGKNNQTI